MLLPAFASVALPVSNSTGLTTSPSHTPSNTTADQSKSTCVLPSYGRVAPFNPVSVITFGVIVNVPTTVSSNAAYVNPSVVLTVTVYVPALVGFATT